MDKTNYKQYIEDSCNWAIYNRFCKTKYEFAKIIGVHPATLYTKSNRCSGKNTARKIDAWRKSVMQTITSEKEEQFDWEEYRRDVAAKMLPVIFSRWSADSKQTSVKNAIEYADELIKQLKEKCLQ